VQADVVGPVIILLPGHPRDHRALTLRLKELAATRVRYGYRRLWILLRREGWSTGHKFGGLPPVGTPSTRCGKNQRTKPDLPNSNPSSPDCPVNGSKVKTARQTFIGRSRISRLQNTIQRKSEPSTERMRF